jgi:tetratricopeptide (TPR) repeat protein
MPEFTRLLVAPLAPGEAFEKAFGKSIAVALGDLRNYVQRPLPSVELGWSPGGPVAEMWRLSSDDVQQARLDLDLQLGRWDTTEAELERLARQMGGTARAETARALVALGQKNVSAAREHFERAIATGKAAARTYYEYAMLLRELGADPRLVTRNVEETVARNPRYAEAWFFLGVEAANRGDPYAAIRAIERAVEILPRQASFRHALVLAYDQAGKREEARKAARRLELGARTPQEREMAQAALRLAEGAEPWVELGRRAPVETPSSWFMPRGDHRVEGTLRRVECLDKQARLLVATADETVSLLVSDPEKVTVRNAGETTFEFGCGAATHPVLVEYVAREDKDAGTVGDVTAIEIRE